MVASTTGIATPSLGARLMERMDFRRDLQRLPIFGLGCAGGVLGLARAAAQARAVPGSRVLFLVVELCALTFRVGDHSKANLVATALFGDGAAAVVLESAEEAPGHRDIQAPRLEASGEYTWPASLDVMGWHIEEDGFGVLFSRDIPNLVRKRLAEAVEGFLAPLGISRATLDAVICHPGGAKVIDALAEVFGAERRGIATSREVLRDYGNMSAATVLFALERQLACDPPEGPALMTALGPGFTAGFALLRP